MKSSLTILPSTLLMLAGCVHSPTPTVFIREVSVQAASTNTLEVIRFPAAYKAYTVGRRPDPHNPGLMSEAHVLYVRESSDRWNLHPPGLPAGLPAQTVPSADGAFAPLPLDQQIRTDLQEQRRLSRALQEQTQRFQQTADVFVPTAQKAVEVSAQLQQRQQQLDERLRRLEEGQRWAQLTNWPASTSTNR